MKSSKYYFWTIIGLLSVLAVRTQAQEPTIPSSIDIPNPLGRVDSVPILVANIISAILAIVGALALMMFVWGGLMWMTSQGNTERVTKGKNTLVWAVIGLLIIFASYAILSTIFGALNGNTG